MKCGVFLSRFQPVHKGHLKVISKMLEDNELVLIIVGSANKSGTQRNPIDCEMRLQFLKDALDTLNLDQSEMYKILITTLDDWSMEDAYEYAKEWGSFLYYNIVSKIHQKRFSFYYNDDISIISNWFEPYIRDRIDIIQLDRTDDNISSTAVRRAVLDNNIDYLVDSLASSTIKFIPYLKECFSGCNNTDFIMS